MELVAAVLSGFIAALLTPIIWRVSPRASDWLTPAVPLALTIYFASLVATVSDGETVTGSYDWAPALDVSLTFYVDGLGLLFALLITGIGTLIMLYAGPYLAGNRQRGRFHALMLTFMASMLGLVLADNVFALVVFWELTALSSFFLIGFFHEREDARASAWKALMVTGIGGQALLAGMVLLGIESGSWSLSVIVRQGDSIHGDSLYLPILLLIALAAFTKSAQAPFHFWLPDAMVAPAPVSAYLHSATMVKAGIYLLARLSPVLGGTDAWRYLLTAAGGVTMVMAAWLAFQETDLKRILAYATISVLGTLTLLLGIESELAVEAALVMLVVHAFYKGALFLVVGGLDHATGSRDLRELAGLRRTMPVTWAAALLAAASLAGLPLLAGFLSKELLYDATLQAPQDAGVYTTAVVLAKTFLVAVAAIVAIVPFTGRRSERAKEAHESPAVMLCGSLALAGAGLALGLAPQLIDSPLIEPAMASVTLEVASVKLPLWPEFDRVLLLSALTIAAGTVIFQLRRSLQRAGSRLAPAGEWDPSRFYDRADAGLNWVAQAQTRMLQSGYLRYYLLIVLITTVGLVGGVWSVRADAAWPDATPDARIYELVIAAGIVTGALMAIRTTSRLGAVVALGIIGYSVALIYVLFGATDLAIVQVLVETLTVILFIFMFYHLPQFSTLTSRAGRARDAAVAISVGTLVTMLTLAVTETQRDPVVFSFYLDQVQRDEHRRNVVNAIITDFRSLDTFGEVTVFVLAGVGVFALLKLRLEGPAPPRESVVDERTIQSLVLSAAVRFLVPIMALYSVFLFLRGSDQPGGGFAGGTVAAAAIVLYAIAHGVDNARQILPVENHNLMAGGLLLVVASGVISLAGGEPLFTSTVWHTVDVPGVGLIELGNHLLFETGIFALVTGVALMIIFSIGEE